MERALAIWSTSRSASNCAAAQVVGTGARRASAGAAPQTAMNREHQKRASWTGHGQRMCRSSAWSAFLCLPSRAVI